MKPELWRQAEELFHAAVDLAPHARSAFLDGACGRDAELRRQVELLISKDEYTGSLLRKPAGPDLTSILAADGLLPGRQLGCYRIISFIGAGGMGDVYRAHDDKLCRDVALKTLRHQFGQEPARFAGLHREARILATLNHPNIAAIYGLEEASGLTFLVLELVEGEMLHGPLPVGEALELAVQLSGALAAAHEKGIIHRDLKPTNIKVTPQGTVKVLDFGLAKGGWGRDGNPSLSNAMGPTGVDSLSGHIVGTPGYMSPEQARGGAVDQRTDIWAFGCLLYELLSGKRAFSGPTVAGTISAVLEREPDWQALPARTPPKIRNLLHRCLEKDADRRLTSIAEARCCIEEVRQVRNRSRVGVIAVVGLAAVAIGAGLWLRVPAPRADRSQWEQITKFTDPVSQPALSADGRMLAFVRSPSTFVAAGEVYVKRLPDGELKQLTHDSLKKVDPVFTPDSKQVAYTVVDPQFNWETWIVSVEGGEPRRWLRNAAHLSWTGSRLLFSTMRPNPHGGVVVSEESRTSERDVYFPLNHRAMAHRPHASPDGKWVLLAEVGEYGNWERCRVVAMDGRSPPGRTVGPPGPCTFGAWSPDSKWVYVTSKNGGLYHIWRQRLPDGKPEQVTSGLTQEEGIAMAPDGHSFVTTVALESSSLWIHDHKGERQISVPEGNAAYPKFAPDGKRVYYRVVKAVPRFGTNRDPGDVWWTDLESGASESLARGFQPLDFDISPDGKQVVMEAQDSEGKPRLWVMPAQRGARPWMITNVEGRRALFSSTGEIFFLHNEGPSGFVYGIRPDGSGLRKALEAPVFAPNGVPPGGRWIEAWAPVSADRPSAVQIFPLAGGKPTIIGSNTWLQWSRDGDCVWITGGAVHENISYIVPLPIGKLLPRIPAGGFRSEEEVVRLPGARKIDAMGAPGPTADIYAFERHTVQRNLYRIPIP